MGAFDRARKLIIPGKNKNKSAGNDDFDFDELSEMSADFDDDHQVSGDRKSSIKSYVKEHYSAKMQDSSERKRLLKASLPGSYSGTVDLASDLRDDLSSMRYELGREWEKQNGSVKKTLKGFEAQLKFLKMNKVVDWANSSGRGSYQDDPVDQNEALVASMMGDFLGPGKVDNRQLQQTQKLKLKEKTELAEHRQASLNAQLRGTVSAEATVNELRKLTNYQDQVTYVYQKKSLEVQIRSYVEHKQQTELLRTYKDESIAELKEIHKNTGLPDAVKINQNEFAAQVFKEKMLGNVSNWFDGNTAAIRKRVTVRIKDKLLDMTKNFGSSLESFLGMSGADDEQGGGGLAKMLMGMGADMALDHPYNKLTGGIAGRIRGKLGQNSRVRKLGTRMNALTKNAGMFANNALLTGESGNGLVDSLMDFFGMRQAAVSKSDKVRGSMAQNLDTAAYMDVKFKQTVERVIPGWLSLIHKENKLIRMGLKDDKNFKAIEWDWNKEDFTSKESKEKRVVATVMNRDRTIEHSEAYERLLHHFDSFSLSEGTKDKLRTWLFKKVRASRSITLYDLLRETDATFKGSECDEIYIMISVQGGLDQADIEGAKTGLVSEAQLIRRDRYASWLSNLAPLYQQVAGKSLIDWKQIQDLAARGEEKILEENGFLIRDADGNLNRNNDFEEEMFKNYARFKHKKTKFYKESGDETVKDLNGKNRSQTTYELDASKSDMNWEDALYDIMEMQDNEHNRRMNRWLTTDVLDERDSAHFKAFSKTKAGEMFLMREAEAKKRGLSGNMTRASGGYIPSFAKGGPTGDHLAVDTEFNVKLHGKEFVTDKETTEKNRRLLEFMNKFKAPVVLPDGSVNPIYYKAFGYKTEEEFKNSDTDTRLNQEQSKFYRSLNQAANEGNNDKAYGLITELFTSLDLSRIPDQDLNKLINPRTSMDQKFKLFLDLRKKHSKPKRGKAASFGGGIAKARNLLEGNGEGAERVGKAKAAVKGFFNKAKADILSMSEQQADLLVTKAMATLDDTLLSESELETLTDPSVSSKDKALLIAKLTSKRGDKAAVAKKAFNDGLNTVKAQAKSQIKNFINGGTDDTTNSDNLKAIADIVGAKAGKGKAFVNGKLDILNGIANDGKLDEKAKELGNKLLVKMRADKAASLAKKFWKDHPIDIFVTVKPEEPRLTAAGFIEGLYIDEATQRVLTTHHDITGPVKDQKGEYLLTMVDFEHGLIDKEGNPIFINSLKRYRNIAQQKGAELYKKYGQKYVNKGIGAMLGATEKWQALFKKTDIDIYMGEGKEPRLTGNGFREGRYISVITKKPLKGYLDIDGPVMSSDGTMIITTDEISTMIMLDKDGNTVKPPKLMSNMGRLGSLVLNALSFDKAYGIGKKAFGKLKDRFKAWKAKRNKDDEGAEVEGDPLTTKPGSRYGSKLKAGLKRLAGYETGEDGTKGLRIGSWQWKRKKKEEDGWMSKFSGLFGAKKTEEGPKKKGILGKILGAVMGVGGMLMGAVNKLTGGITGGLFKMAKWLVPSLGKNLFTALGWFGKPVLGALAFIGKKIGMQAMGGGMGIGRMAKIGGLAAGGYMAYQGLKGSEKLDENGQPVLDENGKPVVERDWGTAAMGAATMALSTGAGLKAAGSMVMGAGTALRIGAGILSGPVGWATLGATAAYYGGKWALGAWKKGKAAKENPILSFRINQYGFDMTDENVMQKIMQLESTLQPNLVIQGEKINLKSDMDVESVFSIFGLKYEGGDAEANKKFLTWFLGRFKPVYLAHTRALNEMKKKTDLSTVDTDLSVEQRLTYLDKVHFKNQMDLNPYNILVSPFTDPDKTKYDFEDLVKKYEKIKAILSDAAKEEKANSPAAKEAEAAEKENEPTLADSVKKGMTFGIGGGIIGGSIWALKKMASSAGDIFNATTEGLGKTMSSFIDGMMSKVSAAAAKVKNFAGAIGDGISDGASSVADSAAGAWDSTKNFLGFDSKVGAGEKGMSAAGKQAGMDNTELAMFLAQTAHESGNFRSTTENLKYSASTLMKLFPSRFPTREKAEAVVAGGPEAIGNAIYGGRMGNSATEGYKYRGRGYIQLTGKDNYKRFSQAAGVDAVSNPDYVSSPEGAIKASLWYWNDRKGLREAAKKGDINTTTKLINGGSNGLADRKQKFSKYLEMVKSGKISSVDQGTTPGAADATGPAGSPSKSTGVMMSDAKTGGAKGAGGGSTTMATSAAVTGSAPAGGSSKGVATPAATATKAITATPTGGLATLLAKCTPELVNLGKSHYSLNTGGKSKVTIEGMNEQFMQLFYAMIGEAKQKGLGKILITEGVRTLAEQQRLYNLYKSGHGALAAYPGKSLHGFGHAMDINTPNADALDKSGLLAKYGFSRPLMKTVKGKRTEQWHIENKFVPRNGATPSYPKMNTPVTVTSSSPSTQNVSYQSKDGKITKAPSSNAGLSNVMGSGGFDTTSNVSSAQQNDMAGLGTTNSILTKQLTVQTEIRNTLTELKNHFIRPEGEIDQLKKSGSPENIGATIGGTVAEALAERLGLNKPVEKTKAAPVIFASK